MNIMDMLTPKPPKGINGKPAVVFKPRKVIQKVFITKGTKT